MNVTVRGIPPVQFLIGVLVVSVFGISVFGQSGGTLPAAPYGIPRPAPPAPATSDDQEGFAVAASSRLIVIGRPGREVLKDGATVEAAGQVLVWDIEEGYLKKGSLIDAIVPVGGAFFGGAVGAGDNWVAVAQGLSRIGIPGAVSGTKVSRVQMIKFLPNGDWRVGQDLIPSGPDAPLASGGGFFGEELAMEGSTLVVSSAGGPVIYDLNDGGIWTRSQRIDPPASVGGGSAFGRRVAISGDLLLVGASAFPNQTGNGFLQQQGRAYLYRRGNNGLYELEADFLAPDPEVSDHFGDGVSVQKESDSEMVAIAAPDKDVRFSASNLKPNYGNVYIFRRDLPNDTWLMEKQITNFFKNTTTTELKAGTQLALQGRRLAVCSGPSAKGVEFFYRYDDGTWTSIGGDSGAGGYGHGLAGFEHGFVIGKPFSSGRVGGWDWKALDPYLAFLNQPPPPGPWLGSSNVSDRRGDADPDGDGIRNSDELFFGSDPLTANTNGVMRPTPDESVKQFKIQWEEAANTYGLKSKPAWSTNVFSNSWQTNNFQIVTLTNRPGSSNKRYEARLSINSLTNVFFRLVIE